MTAGVPAAEREELMRYRCTTDDGTYMTVVEYRHFQRIDAQTIDGKPGSRRRLGARRLVLATGEDVRHIDAETFEIIHSGELLRRLD